MIFDSTTCCACAAVQELQGEAPLTLSGEGLWAGVLSSGQCVLECPGSQSAAGSSGDLLLGFGTQYSWKFHTWSQHSFCIPLVPIKYNI